MSLLLSNVQQRQQADCLVACAAMVLQYLYIPFTYDRLLNKLGTADAGTPFSRLELLKDWRLTVMRGEGNLETLQMYLDVGLPIIVAIRTWAFPHWRGRDTEHAVVVVGIDQNNFYLNDPAIDEAPQTVTYRAFLAAWGDRDYEYAVIGLEDFSEADA
jgi:ABC-type bacteriocin/lantibiotic exporter with double-glycine peptidase domain